jgi:hypothetical protein
MMKLTARDLAYTETHPSRHGIAISIFRNKMRNRSSCMSKCTCSSLNYARIFDISASASAVEQMTRVRDPWGTTCSCRDGCQGGSSFRE